MNLREVAKNVTQLSELMTGREKIDTSTLIKKYPDGVHIMACDLIVTADAEYCCILIKEDDKVFYNGGLVLTKIVKAWCGCGDLSEVNAELLKSPVKIKLSERKTKDGKNNITTVEVL